jgi:hypothetical protein
LKYTFDGLDYDFDITAEIHRTSAVGDDSVKHTFNIILSQYLYDDSTNLFNIFDYDSFHVPYNSILPSASFSTMDATFEGFSQGADSGAGVFPHFQSTQK